MKWFGVWLLLGGSLLLLVHCQSRNTAEQVKVRGLVDTVGFAHTATQMDSVMARIDRMYGKERQDLFRAFNITPDFRWKVVISPHDDYAYAGEMYPYVMENLSAPHLILFGVAHKARLLNLQDVIVFDTFDFWRGPYGRIPVADLREEIEQSLADSLFVVSDSMEQMEHSLEALLPFIQYYHRSFDIVPILVPYMSFDRMQVIARALAKSIARLVKQRQWHWGKDFAIAISNDCVHYGDQDWGGKNYAPFGADSAGYRDATNRDLTIVNECLIDYLDPLRIKRFVGYTVKKQNYKEYAWTWCGRYSVPFGLLTAYYLQQELKVPPLRGRMLRYSTSISNPVIPVEDLGMGVTAPANIHHWVGYVSIGYY